MEINIEQLASDLNNKEINKKQVLEKYSIKDKAMRILLKQNGYIPQSTKDIIKENNK